MNALLTETFFIQPLTPCRAISFVSFCDPLYCVSSDMHHFYIFIKRMEMLIFISVSSFLLLDLKEPPEQTAAGHRLVLQPDRPVAAKSVSGRGRKGGERAGRRLQPGQRDPAEEGRCQCNLEQVRAPCLS